MARIQLSYQGYGTDSIDMIVPRYGDNRKDFAITKEEFYSKKYPVLWLLHGGMGCNSDWLRYTEVERFAAEKHLFVVCISGENGDWLDMAHGTNWAHLLTEYVWDLVHEMFPMASDKREENYIAGLSMGGYGAMHNGMANPDKYGYIGSFSGAVKMAQDYAAGAKFPPFMEEIFGDTSVGSKWDNWHTAKLRKEEGNLPKVYMACGTKDSLFPGNEEYRDYLLDLGCDVTWDQEDLAHEWKFWNHQIEKFIAWLPET